MSEAALITSDLKASDVMTILNIRKPETLYALVASKSLPAYRVGRQYRFCPDAVEAFRTNQTTAQVKERKARRQAALPEWARGVAKSIK